MIQVGMADDHAVQRVYATVAKVGLDNGFGSAAVWSCRAGVIQQVPGSGLNNHSEPLPHIQNPQIETADRWSWRTQRQQREKRNDANFAPGKSRRQQGT